MELKSPLSPNRLPGRTTPTWEVELLISGAVVFALFQLLDPLELWFAKWVQLAPGDRDALVVYGYFYAKLVLFVLIATFVIHIGARATWVALVGVNSIYPGGPKWDNLGGGPIGRNIVRGLTGDIDEAIERADNRASMVFSYGILAAQFSIMILIATLVAIGLSMVFSIWFPSNWSLVIALLLLVLPLILFGLLDKLFGARLRADGWVARLIRSGLRLGHALSLSRFTSPLLPLITTNVGGRRGTWVLIGVVYLALGVTAGHTMLRTDKFHVMRGDALPRAARSRGAHPVHYASLRDDLQQFSSAPYIPQEVIEGPYLRLFVPYVADRHDLALAEHCEAEQRAVRNNPADQDESEDEATSDASAASAQAMAERDAAARQADAALMACFAGLLQIRLDGQAVPGLRLERQRDPFSGHDGGLAMIDVRELARGRHELEIRRLPMAPSALNVSPRPPQPPDRIVFWR